MAKGNNSKCNTYRYKGGIYTVKQIAEMTGLADYVIRRWTKAGVDDDGNMITKIIVKL